MEIFGFGQKGRGVVGQYDEECLTRVPGYGLVMGGLFFKPQAPVYVQDRDVRTFCATKSTKKRAGADPSGLGRVRPPHPLDDKLLRFALYLWGVH